MKKATVGNLFGGSDHVRVRRDGTVRVISHTDSDARQLTLFGDEEFASTLTPWGKRRVGRDGDLHDENGNGGRSR